jgi:hypothetical protein
MRRYKFQALVTVRAAAAKRSLGSSRGPSPRRLVLRTVRQQLFTVLVSRDDETAVGPGSDRVLVTLRVAGDDVPGALNVGDHFHLWDGDVIAEGIISRRLYTWPT